MKEGNKQVHKNIRIVSIGGATYDLFLYMGDGLVEQGGEVRLAVGGKIPVKQLVESSGGGACNTSVGFARLGLDAAFCGVVGSDQWGEKMLKTLQNEGVDTSSATIVENETSSFSIILSLLSGDRTILYTPGANEHLDHATLDLEKIKKTDAVYLNHLSENSCSLQDDIVATLVNHPDIWLSWNPGGPQIKNGIRGRDEAALLQVTNLLLLNLEEALAFTGEKNSMAAIDILLQAGARNVCVTDAEKGVTGGTGEHVFHYPVLPVKVVETTGAGDAFGVGSTWALLSGLQLPEALMAGTLNSAGVIGAIGAQTGLLNENQIRKKMLANPLKPELIR
ncbi:hypothetical protein A3A67_00980 [Candidatus Peribacteria bacterium RIFCSPLOWO2_01_FULL_51_18]|nr:MAG: hypothetical protein A3C52_04710 [Candidatus Peribacteria bacterium RIFCSPHIGHO2_02_FULL_51_15]OGJ66280.1 MAG: hypothetical protein A3A67_00980 [Candidatus Peribacteria bacterium RIFCSPLOWO2_01_FULL_51_18]OGJ68432.1 MAG: hypothetical protein A3J34_03530 [Candidatus Peribacteria bacterium RIFCSPLOWO2_02_FULL_51_10]